MNYRRLLSFHFHDISYGVNYFDGSCVALKSLVEVVNNHTQGYSNIYFFNSKRQISEKVSNTFALKKSGIFLEVRPLPR